MTPIERIEREQGMSNKPQIMDQYFLAKEAEARAEARAARDAKSAKIIAWISLGTSILGTVAAIIALFK